MSSGRVVIRSAEYERKMKFMKPRVDHRPLAALGMIFLVAVFSDSANAAAANRGTRWHLAPRHHTVKRHINKNSHILVPAAIGLSGMRERFRLRRERIKDGVARLKSRAALLEDYSPSDWSGPKYATLGDGGGEFGPGFRTCAMVHSSGFMSGSKLGAEIDRHEAVFRLDADPTLGYEADVGGKTSVRVVAHDSISEVEKNDDILLQGEMLAFHGAEHIYALGVAPEMVDNLAGSHPGVRMVRMTDAFEVQANSLFKKYTNITRNKLQMEFSSGFHALLLMLDLCQDVDLFGIVLPGYCNNPTVDWTVGYRYYQGGVNPTECEVYRALEAAGKQRVLKEREVIQGLVEDGKVTLKRPSLI